MAIDFKVPTAPFKVWHNGHDWVAARTAADATALLAAHCGVPAADQDGWDCCDPLKPMKWHFEDLYDVPDWAWVTIRCRKPSRTVVEDGKRLYVVDADSFEVEITFGEWLEHITVPEFLGSTEW